MAIKELFNRMEGMPKQKIDLGGKVDLALPELIKRVDDILNDEEEELTSDQGNS
jgi:hypothetical protein